MPHLAMAPLTIRGGTDHGAGVSVTAAVPFAVVFGRTAVPFTIVFCRAAVMPSTAVRCGMKKLINEFS